MDKTSLTLGWLVGRRIAGQRTKQPDEPAEPVAYLYNGVRLPELPELDKTVYPYAMITSSYEGEWVLLWYAKEIGQLYVGTYPSGTTYKCFPLTAPYGLFELSDGTWEDRGINNNDQSFKIEGYQPLWTNFDLLDVDGSVYLAASDPIPVYE